MSYISLLIAGILGSKKKVCLKEIWGIKLRTLLLHMRRLRLQNLRAQFSQLAKEGAELKAASSDSSLVWLLSVLGFILVLRR